jgi:hypothetical protein
VAIHGRFRYLVIPGRSEQEIAYHVYLLADAGLIEAENASSHSGPKWYAKHLTYEGHEFVEAARDDTRWHRAKDNVTKTAGALLRNRISMLCHFLAAEFPGVTADVVTAGAGSEGCPSASKAFLTGDSPDGSVTTEEVDTAGI